MKGTSGFMGTVMLSGSISSQPCPRLGHHLGCHFRLTPSSLAEVLGLVLRHPHKLVDTTSFISGVKLPVRLQMSGKGLAGEMLQEALSRE